MHQSLALDFQPDLAPCRMKRIHIEGHIEEMKSILSAGFAMFLGLLLFTGNLASQTHSRATNTVPSVRITTAPPLKQKFVDFNHPPRRYETNRIGVFPLLIEKQLRDEDPALTEMAVHRLQEQVAEIKSMLPAKTWDCFKRIKLFVMYGEDSDDGGRDNGLEYFQKTAPDYHDYLDPRMASSILIYSATNYVWLPKPRALKALMHEFAHAYHLEQWPEAHVEIFEAWRNATHRKLYLNVRDENGTVLPQGYAAQNHLEYFAELSTIYFVGGCYEPFKRETLKTKDPKGHTLIENLWKIEKR